MLNILLDIMIIIINHTQHTINMFTRFKDKLDYLRMCTHIHTHTQVIYWGLFALVIDIEDRKV